MRGTAARTWSGLRWVYRSTMAWLFEPPARWTVQRSTPGVMASREAKVSRKSWKQKVGDLRRLKSGSPVTLKVVTFRRGRACSMTQRLRDPCLLALVAGAG